MPMKLLSRVLSRRFFEQPIFVVGSGRSGTSILVQALGEHPAIHSFKGEAPLIWMLGTVVGILEFSGERKRKYYTEALGVPFDHVYASLRDLAFESAFGPDLGFRHLLKNAVSLRLNPFRVRCWCAKTFPDQQVALALNKLYPSARFIYIHRNGLDVVHSRTQFPGFSDLDFRRHCEDWTESARKYEYLLSCPQAITVGHADLVSDPHAVFNRIQEFLQLPQHAGPAQFASSTQIHSLSSTTDRANVDIRQVMQNREKHHENWSREQRDIFRETCSIEMAKLGYAMPF